MYQSLHTTLMGPSGQPFEIQIRTEEMHKTAEYGIAAHWKYKEGGDSAKSMESQEAKLNWRVRFWNGKETCRITGSF